MEEKSGTFQIDHYVELALKHLWLLIVPLCLALAIGIVLAFVLPKIYEARTLIFVRPQKVPTSYVQSIVETDIESRINTISQQILSRTNLEKIINQFNLFMDPGQEDMFMEDKVTDLRVVRQPCLWAYPRKRANACGIADVGILDYAVGQNSDIVANDHRLPHFGFAYIQ